MKSLHISVAPEVIGHIGALNITNSLVTSLIVMFFLVILALKIKENKSSKKNTPFLLAEFIIEKFYMFFKNIAGEKIEIIFPLLMTFFLFIILGNWIGLLPGIGSIGFYEHSGEGLKLVPYFRGPNADLNTTFALALISVSVTQFLSIKTLGVKAYVSRFINIKNPIKFFVGILELISEFAKILSFSFRLFGNIFAGEVLLSVMIFLIPILVPVPFLILEVFVGFIQALVFTMLTTIFVVIATEESHE